MIALALVASLALSPGGTSVERYAPETVASKDTSYSMLVRRARLAFEQRAWNDAAELWRSALLVDGSVGEHWAAMADAMYRAERYGEAVAAYQRAIQLGALPARAGALDVARAYAQLGNAKQAARWAELARRARDVGSRRTVGDGLEAEKRVRRV